MVSQETTGTKLVTKDLYEIPYVFPVSQELLEMSRIDWSALLYRQTDTIHCEGYMSKNYHIGQVLEIKVLTVDPQEPTNDDRELLFDLPKFTVFYTPDGKVQTRGVDRPDTLKRGNYIILALPKEPEDTRTEREKLRDELWAVRNKTSDMLGFDTYDMGYHHNEVYLALADFVLGRESTGGPAFFYDGYGDKWIRNSRGSYDIFYSEEAGGRHDSIYVDYTLDQIRSEHGSQNA